MLQWIDDFVIHSADFSDHLKVWTKFLSTCLRHHIRLNPKKTTLYAQSARFCGKTYAEDGFHFDPTCMQALKEFTPPVNAEQLQQLVAGMNWMRSSIPHYAEHVEPLHSILEHCYKLNGRRTSKGLAKFTLDATIGWREDHMTLLLGLRDELVKQTQLYFPTDTGTICVFPDSSKFAWGATVTMVEDWRADIPVSDLIHHPIAFYSGVFNETQSRWHIQSKETYAIHQTTSKLRWLLASRRFKLYTDNRNLSHLFHPEHELSDDGNPLPTPTPNRLHRWAEELSVLKYDRIRIPGDHNLWAADGDTVP